MPVQHKPPAVNDRVLYVACDLTLQRAKVVSVRLDRPNEPILEILGGREDGAVLTTAGFDSSLRAPRSWAFEARKPGK